MKNKLELREAILKKMRTLSPADRVRQSAFLTEKFLSSAEFANAKTVGAFVSLPDEIDTQKILAEILARQKTLALPRCCENKNLEFHAVASFENLAENKFGIREPATDSPKFQLAEIDLLLVPAVAVDNFENRLGRGKGFYDRVLADFHGTTITLAFDFQVLAKIPTEAHDRPVDRVIKFAAN